MWQTLNFRKYIHSAEVIRSSDASWRSAFALPVLIACVVLIGSQAQAQTLTSTKSGQATPLSECQKRFRLAEIDAQQPHEPGTMKELCMTVELSCTAGEVGSSDCTKAIADIGRTISSSIGAREAKPSRTR